MGLRFSRRIKIAPGVRLNLGLKGASVSAGVRGAGVTLGRQGLFGSVGVPGTGVSYRTRLAAPKDRRSAGAEAAAAAPESLMAHFVDGELLLRDERGRMLPPGQAQAALRAHRPVIAEALRQHVETLNAHAKTLLDVHLHTPPARPGFSSFDEPRPDAPSLDPAGGRSGPAWAEHMQALSTWRARKAEHERARGPAEPEGAASDRLNARLGALSWPRETQVSFQLAGGGRTLLMDVDLPELEDMPDAELRADMQALAAAERPITEAARRRAYVRHVHSIVFRMLGEAFAALDGLDRVQVAAYTQRVSAATGRVADDYVLDVEADRQAWTRIDFGALAEVDPRTALEALKLRRDLTRQHELRTIEPPRWACA